MPMRAGLSCETFQAAHSFLGKVKLILEGENLFKEEDALQACCSNDQCEAPNLGIKKRMSPFT
jgi:hypothetical protein